MSGSSVSGRARYAAVLALPLCACTALNPAFGASDAEGSGGQSGTDSSGSASSASGTGQSGTSQSGTSAVSTTDADAGGDSTSVSTGPDVTSEDADTTDGSIDPPSFACERRFEIEASSPELSFQCDQAPVGTLVYDNLGCKAISFEDGTIAANDATGCLTAGCFAMAGGPPQTISVDGVDLEELFGKHEGLPCALIEITARVTGDDGTCVVEHVSLFQDDGALVGILGNTIPIDAPSIYAVPSNDEGMATIVTLEMPPHPGVPCGDGLDECDASGWRDLVFDGGVPAGPDGTPVSSMFVGQALSVFNWGLQIDTDCSPRGRWAIVPQGNEWIFE